MYVLVSILSLCYKLKDMSDVVDPDILSCITKEHIAEVPRLLQSIFLFNSAIKNPQLDPAMAALKQACPEAYSNGVAAIGQLPVDMRPAVMEVVTAPSVQGSSSMPLVLSSTTVLSEAQMTRLAKLLMTHTSSCDKAPACRCTRVRLSTPTNGRRRGIVQ